MFRFRVHDHFGSATLKHALRTVRSTTVRHTDQFKDIHRLKPDCHVRRSFQSALLAEGELALSGDCALQHLFHGCLGSVPPVCLLCRMTARVTVKGQATVRCQQSSIDLCLMAPAADPPHPNAVARLSQCSYLCAVTSSKKKLQSQESIDAGTIHEAAERGAARDIARYAASKALHFLSHHHP